MGIYNLDRIFQPDSVAVIGATEKENSIGNALMTNLENGGFPGKIVPINPKYSKVHGIKTLESIRQHKNPIDLAIIATPISTVPDIINDCITGGTGGAVIISAGGKEAGEQGRDFEKKFQEKAYAGGLRLIGPNCLGIINTEAKLNASFASAMPSQGKLAFVSQSGAICTSILDLSFKENIGFSHFVSIGSMVDVDFGDMIDYLGNDSRAGSILLYIENLTQIRKFMSAARAVSRIKPIVVLKSGRSEAGARAASSHTGALAGEDAVYDTAFKRAGIIRVKTIAQLFDCAELMAKPPRPEGSRLAIITNGGGPGVMATDALADHGLKPAPLSRELTEALDDILPPFWSRNNPIDILGDATRKRFTKTFELCRESRSFDSILTIMVPQALTDPEPVAEALATSAEDNHFPVFASWIGGKKMEAAMDVLNQAKIPTYETPERAVQAFVFMVAYNRNLELLTQIPRKLSRKLQYDPSKVRRLLEDHMKQESGFLSEAASKEILSAYGIPVNMTQTATTKEDAVSMARKIGYPVALKLMSPDISHKTDARGVQLNLKSDEAVQSAFGKIMQGAGAYNPEARIEGVSVQQHIDSPDYELLIGAKSDVSFGPVIVFGSGGIFAEIMKDRALGLPPLNRLLALRMMEDTRVFKLLQGFRNRPPADMEALEALLMRISQLMVDFPQIAELDMNPVLVKDGHPWSVDARIRLEDTAKSSPMHLIISPYPDEYEFHEKTDDGREIFIRPVKPEDAPLFKELFKELSPTSIYHRFFSAIKEISPAMLARFTQIDYDRQIAKTRKIERVWGTVLRENRKMIALGKTLGFEPRADTDLGEMELKIDLTETDFSFLNQHQPR
jgi:acetyltransferase